MIRSLLKRQQDKKKVLISTVKQYNVVKTTRHESREEVEVQWLPILNGN